MPRSQGWRFSFPPREGQPHVASRARACWRLSEPWRGARRTRRRRLACPAGSSVASGTAMNPRPFPAADGGVDVSETSWQSRWDLWALLDVSPHNVDARAAGRATSNYFVVLPPRRASRRRVSSLMRVLHTGHRQAYVVVDHGIHTGGPVALRQPVWKPTIPSPCHALNRHVLRVRNSLGLFSCPLFCITHFLALRSRKPS